MIFTCILFTYIWIPYKKKKYKRKSSINPLKLIKGVWSAGESEAWKQVSSSLILLRYFCVLFTPVHKTKQNIRSDVQMCRYSVEVFWVCKYSIRFQVIKLKLLCETLKNEKWKILAWYPNEIRRYRQGNPKCGDWRWTNFQMQVACHYLVRNIFSRTVFSEGSEYYQ